MKSVNKLVRSTMWNNGRLTTYNKIPRWVCLIVWDSISLAPVVGTVWRWSFDKVNEQSGLNKWK